MDDLFEVLILKAKTKFYSTKNPNPSKLSFTNESKIKTFPMSKE